MSGFVRVIAASSAASDRAYEVGNCAVTISSLPIWAGSRRTASSDAFVVSPPNGSKPVTKALISVPGIS